MTQHVLDGLKTIIDEKAVLQKKYDAAIDRLGKARVALSFGRSFVGGYSRDHPHCQIAKQAIVEADAILSVDLFGKPYPVEVAARGENTEGVA